MTLIQDCQPIRGEADLHQHSRECACKKHFPVFFLNKLYVLGMKGVELEGGARKIHSYLRDIMKRME